MVSIFADCLPPHNHCYLVPKNVMLAMNLVKQVLQFRVLESFACLLQGCLSGGRGFCNWRNLFSYLDKLFFCPIQRCYSRMCRAHSFRVHGMNCKPTEVHSDSFTMCFWVINSEQQIFLPEEKLLEVICSAVQSVSIHWEGHASFGNLNIFNNCNSVGKVPLQSFILRAWGSPTKFSRFSQRLSPL